MVTAIVVGTLFNKLADRGTLPASPQRLDLPADFKFWKSAKEGLSNAQITPGFCLATLVDGIKESRMVIRWILFGVLLAGLVRAFISPDQFGTYFRPTVAGLGLTVLVATIIEVCSEGSAPIAADLLNAQTLPETVLRF